MVKVIDYGGIRLPYRRHFVVCLVQGVGHEGHRRAFLRVVSIEFFIVVL